MTDTLTAADLLRPTDFDGYIGQAQLKAEMNVRIKSALLRQEPLPHTLLTGPPGSGKTTLAGIIANELGTIATVLDCPLTDESYRAMRASEGFLFFDEIHRLPRSQEEDLLTLLEHGYIKPKGKPRCEWDAVTVIGATTEPGKLIRPLKDRFPIRPHFSPYADDEIATIGAGMAVKLGIEMDHADLVILGRAAAGTPRRVSHFLTAARDIFVASGSVQVPTAAEVLDFMRCTTEGLTPDHVKYLTQLTQQAPLGLTSLRELLDMDEGGVVELERLLQRLGYIEKSGRGRDLTPTGYRRIKELMR